MALTLASKCGAPCFDSLGCPRSRFIEPLVPFGSGRQSLTRKRRDHFIVPRFGYRRDGKFACQR
jgi:hypothetical protein